MFRKILAALGTAALALGLTAIAVAAPASATNPVVAGIASCNTTTGTYDVTWRVTGDTGYQNETATITSATISSTVAGEVAATTTSLIGKTVKGAGFVEAVQQGATKGASYQLTVKVQWTNHSTGDLITQKSNVVVPSGSCITAQPNTATAVLKITSANCKAPATMTYGATTFASFTGGTPSGATGATAGTDLTHYSVTATSDNNHTFSDGTRTLVLEGDLDPQQTGPDCIPTPTCLPGSVVSYSYDPASNSGRITVADVANSTHVLCDPFWVTATSWKFTTATVWPQMLDVVQKLGPISAVGSYDYAAAVGCGQGDIYASFDAQPEPTAVLDGPNSPFAEHFLHDMGFTGPNPTYVQQDPACTSVKPTVGYELGACYQNGTAPDLFSSSNLTLVFDNSKSTVPVTFSVPSASDVKSTVNPTPSIERTVPAGQVVKVETTPVWNQGGGYDVFMDGVYSVTIPNGTITVKPFAGCLDVKPGDPSHTNENCTVKGKVLGSITVGLETGLVYSIDGPGTINDISPVTAKTTTGLPAGDYIVKVAAAAGYTLTGADKWPFTVEITPATCGQLVTHPLVTPVASSTPLSCTAVGTYTLTSNPGVTWTVNGSPATAGPYQVSTTSTVLVSATPNAPDYGFEAGIPTPKTYTFSFTKPDAATCATQLTTLAYTGVSSSLWLILSGGLVFIGIGGLLVARRRWVNAS